MTRRYVATLILGIAATWAVLYAVIGPPFDARHEPPVEHWPGWHVDVPG